MKKLLLLFLAVGLFSGCSYRVASKISTSIVDVRLYSHQGFYIQPGSDPGYDYLPLGEIMVLLTHGKTVDVYSGRTTEYNNNIASMDDAVERMVDEAKDLGADCIINFKSDERVGYILLTGFAVKRKLFDAPLEMSTD